MNYTSTLTLRKEVTFQLGFYLIRVLDRGGSLSMNALCWHMLQGSKFFLFFLQPRLLLAAC